MRRPHNASSAMRCAVYTRKSTDDGLEQEYNSLDAQRDAGEAYIRSQANEGWMCLAERYDDGGRLEVKSEGAGMVVTERLGEPAWE